MPDCMPLQTDLKWAFTEKKIKPFELKCLKIISDWSKKQTNGKKEEEEGTERRQKCIRRPYLNTKSRSEKDFGLHVT